MTCLLYSTPQPVDLQSIENQQSPYITYGCNEHYQNHKELGNITLPSSSPRRERPVHQTLADGYVMSCRSPSAVTLGDRPHTFQ